MTKKEITRYTLTITFLLICIWSQSWILILLLLGHFILLWHQPTQKKLINFWNKTKTRKKNLIGWFLASFYAIIILLFINNYLFGIYTLQSSSMEPTYHTGNFFIMNKIEIGTGKSIDNVDTYHRLIGLDNLDYGEVIVFYFPEADTVFSDAPKENYHFKKREARISGKPNNMANKPIAFSPVHERPRFIKRIVALPGDTLQIINGENFINGKEYEYNSIFINKYSLNANTPRNIRSSILNEANATYTEDNQQIIEIQSKTVTQRNWGEYLEGVERPLNLADPYIFPFSTSSLWNASFWGPAVIPAKDSTIELNENNLPLYWRIMEAYEGNKVELKNGKIYLNDKECKQYTFKLNYYWVAGDNRPHSFDSRYWGFVPENHIIGVINKLPFTK
nr:signal peptidase I [uncultured Carboxylicivirga sp.]